MVMASISSPESKAYVTVVSFIWLAIFWHHLAPPSDRKLRFIERLEPSLVVQQVTLSSRQIFERRKNSTSTASEHIYS